jgi:hypothetical protein
MPSYTYTDRDGKEYPFETDKPLTKEDIEYLDKVYSPSRPSDYFFGAAESAAKFGYAPLALAHEAGNAIADGIIKLTGGQPAQNIKNPWVSFSEQAEKTYTEDIPAHVKRGIDYQLVQGATQLTAQLALPLLAPITLPAQGFLSGKEDYYKTIGVTEETASNEEREASNAIGAVNAVTTAVLEKIGLNKLLNVSKASGLKGKAVDVLTAATVEGLTEAAQTVASNVIAKDVFVYDPTRERFNGAGDAALVGFLTGGGGKGAIQAVDYAPDVTKKVINSGKSLMGVVTRPDVNPSDIATPLGAKVVGANLEAGTNFSEPIIPKQDAKKSILADTTETIDKAIMPLKDLVSSVNERVGDTLNEFELSNSKRKFVYSEMAKPGLETLSKISKNKADYSLLKKHILQNEFESAKELFLQYGDEGSWESIGKALQAVYVDSSSRGSDIGYLEKYFPRIVNDYEGLANEAGWNFSKTKFEKLLKDSAETKGSPLTEVEESLVFENALRSGKFSPLTNKTSFQKERVVEKVGDEILKYYADPLESLGRYFSNMSDAVTRIDYLGSLYDLNESQGDTAVYSPEQIESARKVGTKYRVRSFLPKRLRERKTSFKDSPIAFKSDIDKALYLAKNAKSLSVKNEYYKFAQRAMGIDRKQAAEASKLISSELKDIYSKNPGGVLEFQEVFTSENRREGLPDDANTKSEQELTPKQVKKRTPGLFARVIAEERAAGRLSDSDVDKISDYLGARFSKKDPMGNFVRGIKTLTHIAFLANPITTIKQFGDLTYSIHKNGINNTLTSLGKPQYTLSDVYQATDSIAHEFDRSRSGGLSKVADISLSATGFKYLDAKMKNTFLTATAKRWRSILDGKNSSTKTKLIQDFQSKYGFDGAKRLIEDIRQGLKSDLMSEALFGEITQIAPLTQSDMPYYYNKHPTARLLYTLKSYTIKQLQYSRKNIGQELISGDRARIKNGVKNLLSISSSLAVANFPATAIEAFIKGEGFGEEFFTDELVENLWRLMGMNSYASVQMKRDGIGSAIQNMTIKLPMVSVVDDLYRDIRQFAPFVDTEEYKFRSLKYFPVVGKIWDWMLKNED